MKWQNHLKTLVSLMILFSAGVLFSFCAPQAALAAIVSSGDGLVLDFNDKGEVTSTMIFGDNLNIDGKRGGFFLIDYEMPENNNQANLFPSDNTIWNGISGWRPWGMTPQLDRSIKHNTDTGHHSVYVQGAGNGAIAYWLTVKPLTHYRVGMWMKRSKCTSWVDIRGYAPQERGGYRQIYQMQMPCSTDSDYDWFYVSHDILTEEYADKLCIFLNYKTEDNAGITWIDDVSVTEIKRALIPIAGKATSSRDNCLELKSTMNNLQIEAKVYGQPENIRIEGAVKDTTGKDRPVSIVFRLPIDAAGWDWYDETVDRRTIGSAGLFANVGKGENVFWRSYADYPEGGDGLCSRFPWATITSQDKSKGIGWGIPVSQGPRIYLLGYDAAEKYLFTQFDFGLTKKTALNPAQASFGFTLFKNPKPEWGLRSALERYYTLYPDFYRRRLIESPDPDLFQHRPFVPEPFEINLGYPGFWQNPLNYTYHNMYYGGESFPDVSDFGEGAMQAGGGQGCYGYCYFPTDFPETRKNKFLTDDEIVKALQGNPIDNNKALCATDPIGTFLKELVRDQYGSIRYYGASFAESWQANGQSSGKPGWLVNFMTNQWAVTTEYWRGRLYEMREAYIKSKSDPRESVRSIPVDYTGGIYSDYVSGQSNGFWLDYEEEHLKQASEAVTFGKDRLKPGIINSEYEYVKNIFKPEIDTYKLLFTGNSTDQFIAPFIDGAHEETPLHDRDPVQLDRAMRAIAGHKNWYFVYPGPMVSGKFSNQDISQQFKRGLAYTIYPAVATVLETQPDYERWRKYFRQYIPAMQRLAMAGWEPVPYAKTDDHLVVIERYGNFNTDNLLFTLRNHNKETPKTVQVSFEFADLGISEAEISHLQAYDLLTYKPLLFDPYTRRLTITVGINDSAAFILGTPESLARDALRQVDRGLGRLYRLYYFDLSETNRKAIIDIHRSIQSGLVINDLLPIVEQTWESLHGLQGAISTSAPVDLAKTFYRMQNDLSLGVQAVAGLTFSGPRVQSALAGEECPIVFQITNKNNYKIEFPQGGVYSPWIEVQEANSHSVKLPSEIPSSGSATLALNLKIPATPQRKLLPFLVYIGGAVNNQPFHLCRIIDVEIVDVLSGDLSGDGKVTAYDAALAARFTAGARPADEELKRGDVNGDGKITNFDVGLIAKKAVRLIDNFPNE